MFSPSAFDEWSDETFRYLLKKLKAKLLKIEIIDKEWWPYSMVYHIILGDTAHILYFFPRHYGLGKIMATQRARYERCFCVLNWSCIFLFLFCVVLSIFFKLVVYIHK